MSIEREDADHLLLSDGHRSIRLDVTGARPSVSPVRLRYRIGGIAAALRPAQVLRQFLYLVRNRRFSRALHPVDRRARRSILVLRSWDAIRSGASQRELAAILLSKEARSPNWRLELPSVRLQAQRLVREARRLGAGGFRTFLS